MSKLSRGVNNFIGNLIGEPYYRWFIQHEVNRGRGCSPILVWQMGKVGSSSILTSLKHAVGQSPLFHIHLLSDTMLKKGELYKKSKIQGNRAYLRNVCMRKILISSMKAGQKWKIISLVREPVGRNLSSFFQNLDLFYSDKVLQNTNFSNLSVDNLIETFLNKFDHNRPLEWFDEEIKELLGLDVFLEGFPASRGYKTYTGENFDLLLLRMEDLNEIASEAFPPFLGLPSFELISKNVGSDKTYANKYREVKKQIAFSGEYLDRCYNSKYAQHFYTDKELEEYRKRWLKNNS